MFDCRTSADGQVIVTPGPSRTLKIVGAHDVRRGFDCRSEGVWGDGRRCRIVDVHRFNLMCGSQVVPWAAVADAIAQRRALRTRQIAAHDLAREQAVGERLGPITGLSGRFAPLAGTGALIVTAERSAPKPSDRVSEKAADKPAAARRWGASTPVTSQLLPDITPQPSDEVAGGAATATTAPADPPAAARETGDVTMALLTASNAHGTAPIRLPRETEGQPAVPKPAAPEATFWTGWVLVTLLGVAGAAGAACLRWPMAARKVRARAARLALNAILRTERLIADMRPRFAQLPRFHSANSAGGPRPLRAQLTLDVKSANAASTLAALIHETEGRIADIRNAGPLREVLGQECGHLRQRLATLEQSAAQGEEAAARAGSGFRMLTRDIERVRRIADGAALSMGGERVATRVPRTRSEAFDLLGLNPEAPEATLKKVADGLRMSWHPDHARDENDRVEREARVKAINIAIELIRAEPAVA